MRAVVLVVLSALVAACSGDSNGPPAPPTIVSLVVADTNTGFWRSDSLALSTLITGAITDDGDTVDAPALTWTVPAGFHRSGDKLSATREARGQLVASAGGQVPTVPLSVATMDDLSVRGPWSAEHRCYNSPLSHRGVEEPPIGVDSAIVSVSNGQLEYSETEWETVFKMTIAVDERVIRFWKDGVVDTVFNQTAIVAMQDTLSVALGSNIGSASPWMKRTSESPMIYRLDPPGICGSAWEDGGTAFELRAP